MLSIQFAGPAWAQSYPIYSVTPLPALGSVTAFNDGGLILGRGLVPCSGSTCTLSDVPVLYDSRTGALTALSGGFGVGVEFGALNAQGQLAGTVNMLDASGAVVRSVVLRQVDGTLTTLASPSRTATQTSGLQVRGFNAAGQIALEHSDGLDAQTPVCGNYQGWTNTARNATRLVLERCKGNKCTGFVAVATLPGDSARFSDATLARRTAYRWRVRAGNVTGLSGASNVVIATTLR